MQSQDEKTLDLLSTLHYVLGVLTALFACIPFIHFFIGIAMLGGTLGNGPIAPRAVALAFIILSLMIILGGWVLAILMIITGKYLKSRSHYNFCIVISFIECVLVPLGTILGVFTIINLNKESVKELFN